MPNSIMFRYTVLEQEGNLVISVGGSLAENALRQLREGVESGRGLSVQSLLSPLVPIGRLLSAPVQVRGESEEGELLSQEVNQTLEAFKEQMHEFRQSLEELKARKKGASS